MPSYGYKKGTFSNMVELEKGMTAILKEVQRATLERMKEKLDDFISDEVYMKGADEDSWYQRTFDLYEIWETNRVYASHGKIYGSIEPTNSNALSHSAELGQHTTPEGELIKDSDGKTYYRHGKRTGYTELTTKEYVHIINDGLDWYHSMFGDIAPRPFWDKFMEWANKNYDIIFREECIKRGLNIT